MYTRDFNEPQLNVPNEYSGVAFEKEEIPIHKDFDEGTKDSAESTGLLGGLSGLFGKSLLKGGNIPFFKGNFKLGTEELLLLALAAFLFFSKDGDRECALILLFLVFAG